MSSGVSDILTYIVKDIFFEMLRGTKESLHGIYCLHVYYKRPKQDAKQLTTSRETRSKSITGRSRDRSEKRDKKINVRNEIYCCAFYNGVTYGLSLFAFYYIILNLLKLFLDMSLSEDTAHQIWDHSLTWLTILFDMFWTLPLFLIFKIINAFWFQDIANGAYRQRHGRPQPFSIPGFGSQISDAVFSLVIEILFLIQASLMSFVPCPQLATLLSWIHFALLNSLYCFEYLWYNKGWTCHKRISYIESNWPYFIGFGMPLSMVTYFLPSLLQSGFVYSILFPMFIISAIEAPPIRRESIGPPMKLFTGVIWFSSFVTRRLFAQKRLSKLGR